MNLGTTISKWRVSSVLVLSLLGLSVAQAYHYTVVSSQETYIYLDYYIHSKAAVAGQIDLLDMDHVMTQFPLPKVAYNRSLHFGGWIHRSDDHSCFDTRGLVLERDSDGPVKANTHCTVQSGLWHEPYTGQDYTQAKDLQIDHLVPLKNAYMSGAFEWDSARRCLYANYMGNKFHLLSVSGHENMSKSDKSPLEYIPPNQKFECQYLKNWLEVKYIWDLRMTPKEISAIFQSIKDKACDLKSFKIDQNEYQEQLNYMAENQNLCRSSVLVNFEPIFE